MCFLVTSSIKPLALLGREAKACSTPRGSREMGHRRPWLSAGPGRSVARRCPPAFRQPDMVKGGTLYQKYALAQHGHSTGQWLSVKPKQREALVRFAER